MVEEPVSLGKQFEYEVSIFGPSYGESCVARLRNDFWVIIDSCTTPDGSPAALQYLEAKGVDYKKDVKLIIITHWHDDHIGGMSTIVAECSSARVCMPSAFSQVEFLTFVGLFAQSSDFNWGTGVQELQAILQNLASSGRRPVPALESRLLYQSKLDDVDCMVLALSPSDAQFGLAMKSIATLMPAAGETKRRAPDPTPNHLSIAAWIKIGEFGLLFGADLEESGHDDGTGWSAAAVAQGRPNQRAFFFKVPHHGSRNGHFQPVWEELLCPDAIAVLTPWQRGRGLPTKGDVARICDRTKSAYATSNRKRSVTKIQRRSPVQKMIQETLGNNNLRQVFTGFGHVKVIFSEHSGMDVKLFGNACKLSEYFGEEDEGPTPL